MILLLYDYIYIYLIPLHDPPCVYISPVLLLRKCLDRKNSPLNYALHRQLRPSSVIIAIDVRPAWCGANYTYPSKSAVSFLLPLSFLQNWPKLFLSLFEFCRRAPWKLSPLPIAAIHLTHCVYVPFNYYPTTLVATFRKGVRAVQMVGRASTYGLARVTIPTVRQKPSLRVSCVLVKCVWWLWLKPRLKRRRVLI